MIPKWPRFVWCLLFSFFCACSSLAPPVSAGPLAAEVIQVFFSPNGGATEAVVHELRNAKQEILVQAYSFTSAPIAKALVDAHKRGVKVTVVLDRSQRSTKYSSADFVAHAGIPTYIDDQHAIAHNKIMIIDQATIITGSFNFTKAAEVKNAENLLVIKGDAELVKKYIANFEEHLGHSGRYEGR
jgi:phosphatidylserine/phosphatidylglycerophosphate/cardiolipin synthase-like enzyme